jgi:hypothetical protein
MACSNSEFNFWKLRIYLDLEIMNLFGQLVGLLGRGTGPTQGLCLRRTTKHRKTWTHIHASSGIRTHDPSVRVVTAEGVFEGNQSVSVFIFIFLL